ncbi:hypothetical protein QN089_11760 [Kurthia sp. YJT4]|uniref:hypothetical protein n=1 Tax=Kurthia sp. YJT4 TaxID=3049086 RepID=UPI0025500E2D|nr:hypothetical protein [Kurthia sp. YJT4]WIL38003.1 hypothetical protein QN089_11760 [Kurthia sp. YJT4]
MAILISLLGIVTFIFIFIIILQVIGNILPKVQKCILYLLPKSIILVAIVYMITCYHELFVFLDASKFTVAENIIKVFNHKDTYVAMVNFFALLTFYQLLEDRYQKVYSKPFNKLSTLEVITKDAHNQILVNERKKLERAHKAKIRELKRNK